MNTCENIDEKRRPSPADPEELRKYLAARCNLSADATYDQINRVMREQSRSSLIEHYQLPADTTWTQLRVIDCDRKCAETASLRNLPHNTPWSELSTSIRQLHEPSRFAFLDQATMEELREKEARKLGLPEDAPQIMINAAVLLQRRKEEAASFRLPENVSWEVIHAAQDEQGRKARAITLGLPEDATWDQIRTRRDALDPPDPEGGIKMYIYPPEHTTNESKAEADNELRKERAANVGIPEDANWDEIYAAQTEEVRKTRAVTLGLSEDATWDKIGDMERSNRFEQLRKDVAIRFGLDEGAAWEQIEATIIDIAHNDPTADFGYRIFSPITSEQMKPIE